MFVKSMSLLSPGMSLEELQVSTRVVEEKGQTTEADVAKGVSDAYVLTDSIDNTFHINAGY